MVHPSPSCSPIISSTSHHLLYSMQIQRRIFVYSREFRVCTATRRRWSARSLNVFLPNKKNPAIVWQNPIEFNKAENRMRYRKFVVTIKWKKSAGDGEFWTLHYSSCDQKVWSVLFCPGFVLVWRKRESLNGICQMRIRHLVVENFTTIREKFTCPQ